MNNGSNISGYIIKYDTIANTYAELSYGGPNQNWYFGVGLYQGKIKVIGYSRGQGESAVSEIFTYNIATNSWTMGEFATVFNGGSPMGKQLQIGNFLYMQGSYNWDMVKFDLATHAVTRIPYPAYASSLLVPQGAFMQTDTGFYVVTWGVAGQGHMDYRMLRFVMTPKTYPANSVILVRDGDQAGIYYTEFVSPAKLPSGTFPKLKTGFNDVHFYDTAIQKNKETYYGNGSSWIRIK